MRKVSLMCTVVVVGAIALLLSGCAPLRDQNGNPVLDSSGKEIYHKAI